MDKTATFKLGKNSIGAVGSVGLIFSLARIYKATEVTPSIYWQLILSILAVFGVFIWTMIDREKTFRREAQEDFFRKFPEFSDFQYLWILHGLLAQAKAYISQNGMTGERLSQWKAEVRVHLEHWGDSKLDYYQTNLPDDADLKSCIEKLSELLEYETIPPQRLRFRWHNR
jgi:hypothetical protein